MMTGAALALLSIYLTFKASFSGSFMLYMATCFIAALSLHSRVVSGIFPLAFIGFSLVIPRKLLYGDLSTRDFYSDAYHSKIKFSFKRKCVIIFLMICSIATFSYVSYSKFRNLYGIDLKYHVQYKSNPARLERIKGGEIFHVNNILFDIKNYFINPNLILRKIFPYCFLGNIKTDDARIIIDVNEPCTSIPFSMPGLFSLSLIGLCFGIFFRKSRWAVIVLYSSFMPTLLALIQLPSFSYRYLHDFFPFLVAMAALGTNLLCIINHKIIKCLAGVLCFFICLAGLWINIAFSFGYQREMIWGVPQEKRDEYIRWRLAIDTAIEKVINIKLKTE